MARVLVLSVSIGSGHTSAAAAVVKGLKACDPAVHTRVVDAFRYANPLLGKAIVGAYIEALRVSPGVYRQLYELAAKDNLSELGKKEFNRMLGMLMATRLTGLVAEFAPDVIVANHPFPLGVMSVMRSHGQVKVPLVCTMTDFATHPFWLYQNVDLYTVAGEQLKQDLVRSGIPAERIRITGIPIDPTFCATAGRLELRAGLGVLDDAPVVLLMSGGLGLGPLEGTVRDILGLPGKHHLVVVCGRNKELQGQLKSIQVTSGGRLTVLGYVHNVNELMAAADILVSKPGGLTCAESLASSLPLVIPDTIPGPEDVNADQLCAAGAAMRVRSRQSLVDALEFLLRNDTVRSVMRQKAAGEGRPQAAVDIAGAVLSLAVDSVQTGGDRR